ncbi:hypothetical protein [[Mycoplasma] anseris]|uniref:Uncharacterized protein n=1 Tax=[Mycoplasma] anseris TaxID=92400 RepID=A0A2Z4ND07_9BACT|nr:hypothetical protein [[Mycoplasma] anseris]AWX69387.1 hypothetical protein DP065_01295 [[Mycoplasma] anseris]
MKKLDRTLLGFITGIIPIIILIILGAIMVNKCDMSKLSNVVRAATYAEEHPDSIFALSKEAYDFLYIMGWLFVAGAILSAVLYVLWIVYTYFKYDEDKIEFSYLKFGILPTRRSIKYEEIENIFLTTKFKIKIIRIKLKNESKWHSIGGFNVEYDTINKISEKVMSFNNVETN